MGIRGELFSTKMTCEGRTYFFNVKENRMGDVFLTIVESKPTETEAFDRRSIVIFRENLQDFLKAFQGALKYMEKPGREAPEVSFSPTEEMPAALRAKLGLDSPKAPKKAPAPGEKKRRIVVRRKEPTEKVEKEGSHEAHEEHKE
jgi:hypothetical protein